MASFFYALIIAWDSWPANMRRRTLSRSKRAHNAKRLGLGTSAAGQGPPIVAGSLACRRLTGIVHALIMIGLVDGIDDGVTEAVLF